MDASAKRRLSRNSRPSARWRDCRSAVGRLRARECPKAFSRFAFPPPTRAEAEKLIAENPLPDEVEEVDPSSELDLETIASAATEMEATTIKNLLDANGVSAVLVGDSVLPNFAFDVRVAHDQAARAREIVKDAQRGGPAAALKGELESESGA